MTTKTHVAVVMVALAMATAALADQGGNNGKGQNTADISQGKCPPGLAKKNPPCVPPGQAKQGVISADPDVIGAHLPDGYHVVIAPRLYDPDADIIYTRRGDPIYRVARQNGQVMDFIGTIADMLK